ncbi:CU044_2847 family protein [Yinghuangia soli]|uniref:Trypsin-co-occurring domain-containing protein n=1 Tax=Yinghuangia soli TaxID=2908204 RepID=A0AA41PXI7_9ACTN|nr:CU044_2847 family protein [Yinghuangia soli]MCF2527674.1 hypothetical protein [Yinghuangia soli]
MSDIVEVETPDGATIWVRIAGADSGPRDTAFGRSRYRLTDLPQTLRSVVGSVRTGLEAVAPDEVVLEFSIELTVKTGVLVTALAAGSEGAAALKITATWNKSRIEGGDPRFPQFPGAPAELPAQQAGQPTLTRPTDDERLSPSS